MYTHKIPTSSLWAWICAAAAGPVAMLAAGCSWSTSLLLGVTAAALNWRILKADEIRLPRPLLLLELVWTGAALLWALQESCRIWPDSDTFPAVPLVLLLLGAWASSDSTRGPRIGSVCLRLLAPLAGAVLLCALGDVRWTWVAPGLSGIWPGLALAMLLPSAAFLLPRGKERPRLWPMLLPALAVVVSLCTGGVLSPWVAAGLPQPLWELGRSIRLFGSSLHLESVLCAGLALSWFCLCAYLLTQGAVALQILCPRRKTWGRWLLAAAVAVALLCRLTVPTQWMLAGSLLFWVLIPILAQAVAKIKKVENLKKSA